jgi:hypothetical protein
VEVDPQGPSGLLLRDPDGIRILDPIGGGGVLRFGPTNECILRVTPDMSGLIMEDPGGFRLLGKNRRGARLLFGPTDLCTIGVEPDGPSGVLIRDPGGVRVINPNANAPEGNELRFGTFDECRIAAGSEAFPGIMFADPNGFLLQNPLEPGGAQVNVDGSVFANEFVQMSSRRFKKNVRQIENPLEKVQQLKGVSFDWVSGKGGKPAIGFIAEEVGKVIPEVVAWEEGGKSARGINYGHLVALTVEGIKAQQSEIESLRKQNSELERRLAKLEELVLKSAQKTGE